MSRLKLYAIYPKRDRKENSTVQHATVGLLVLASLMLAGCESHYDEGYAEGQKAGYAEGHMVGYSEGHEAGYAEGVDAVAEEALEAGLKACNEKIDSILDAINNEMICRPK